jgi:hypothetical protein
MLLLVLRRLLLLLLLLPAASWNSDPAYSPAFSRCDGRLKWPQLED